LVALRPGARASFGMMKVMLSMPLFRSRTKILK
jgi:hypothetical protein